MPRRKRAYVAGLPYHIVQRGNNRSRCFFAADDFAEYLRLWRAISRRRGVAVHAYCLMSNHVHFLVTGDTADAISTTLQSVSGRYAQLINQKYARTGTLWEGRHRSSLVDADAYLIACYRYIELNPVRAGLVATPGDYPWSSWRTNALGVAGWLTPHPQWLALAASPEKRRAAYRELFESALPAESVALIRLSSHFSQPVGTEDFRHRMAALAGVAPGYLARGRPRRAQELVKN